MVPKSLLRGAHGEDVSYLKIESEKTIDSKTSASTQDTKNLPHIVSLAIGFAIPNETRAALVEKLPAFLALETGRMPLEIGSDAQNVLVVVLGAAANAQRKTLFFCT